MQALTGDISISASHLMTVECISDISLLYVSNLSKVSAFLDATKFDLRNSILFHEVVESNFLLKEYQIIEVPISSAWSMYCLTH